MTYTSRRLKKTTIIKSQLMAVIPRGRENAIKSDTLKSMLGLSGKREVGQVIQEARSKSEVILSDTVNGYYLPSNKTEIENFIKSMERRGKMILKATKSAKKQLALIEGQEEMEVNS